MPVSEICSLAAVEMAALIRRGQLSAREVVEAHLAQIERVNPTVNALVTLVADRAADQAGKADEDQARGLPLGPLHGLPVAHKDLFDTAGVRTTYGSPVYRDYVPAQDAISVERIRGAGAIILGKTNTPEFGAGSQTFNPVFGATRNPYDLSKTCGGSSGGSAVALACGMTALADGTDTGGSLRNPAAFCGVVGLRPAPGRVPEFALPNPWSTLNVSGPMGRTVADAALLLSVMAGPDPRCPIAIGEPGGRFAERLERDFHGTRVAWFRNLAGVPFDRRVLQAVNARRQVFEDLGCVVEEAEPDLSGAEDAFQILRAWGFAAKFAALVRDHRDLVKDTIIWEVERGAKLDSAEIARALAFKAEVWNRMRLFFERYEYFILPTSQVPPFDVDQPYVTEIEGVAMTSYIDWMKSCYWISLAENPAISVPCGFTPEGLPIGLQIVGRHRDEWSVLQLAHAFEEATRADRRAPLLSRPTVAP